MAEHKRLMNAFDGVLDKVKIALMRRDNELFLYNNSEQVLEKVTVERGGFMSDEDHSYTVIGDKYEYEHVKIKESVKIDEYNNFYDNDIIMQYYAKVITQSGENELSSEITKGGIKNLCVLV